MAFSGYFIPKGWKVFAWSRGVHMDPEIYSDPLEFNPERWDVSIHRCLIRLISGDFFKI